MESTSRRRRCCRSAQKENPLKQSVLEPSDTYKTISDPTEPILFKEKNSKFFGYAFAVTSEEEIKECLAKLRKLHSGANHFCYAFQIGTSKLLHRVNDDGEPANTAGMPIYGQIQSYGLTNILVVAVRFFGGTKLGAGGLISAYRTTAQLALATADIVECTIDVNLIIRFDYKNTNKVMRIIKEKRLRIIRQTMESGCEIRVALRKKDAPEIAAIFEHTFEIEIEWEE